MNLYWALDRLERSLLARADNLHRLCGACVGIYRSYSAERARSDIRNAQYLYDAAAAVASRKAQVR